MGFFSFLKPILDIAAPIGASLLGVDPALITGGAATTGVSAVVAKAVTTPTAREVAALASGGGLRRRTIVETFDPKSGVVTKREVMPGAPAVMQSDVAAANRLNRQLRKLNARQPKKLVKQSVAARLKEEVVESALRHAIHNGNGHGTDNDPIIVNRS